MTTVENYVKDNVKQQLLRVISQRSYQIAAFSAALVLTSGAGLLVAQTGETPTPARSTAAGVESNSDAPGRASRSHPARPSAPIAAPSPTLTETHAATKAPSTRSAPPKAPSAPPKAPATKLLDVDYQAQINFYYCGPAATRIALTARGVRYSQDAVAVRLNTTVNGTDSAQDTTRVLNALTTGHVYRTRWIQGGSATPGQITRLQADVVKSISGGYALVANIAGSAVDTAGGWHSFPGGHYVAVTGYRNSGRMVQIADPADPGNATYWMSTADLANWMATRGYSA